MINKKILAVAVAAAVSTNAFAAIDISDPASVAAVFASEFVTAAPTLAVTNAADIVSVASPFGFSIGDGTSKYIRLELSNATFLTPVTMAEVSEDSGFGSFSISQGGGAGDSSVVIEVAAGGGDIQQIDAWTLAAADFTISQTAASTVMYTLHDTAADAVNNMNALSTQTGPLAQVAAVTSGTFTAPSNSIATVATSFMEFVPTAMNPDSDALTDVLGLVGGIDTDLYLTGTGYMADGTLVVAGDLITAMQTVTFTGDFSFGAWHLDTMATCAGVATALTPNADMDGTDPEAIADVNVDSFLCVTSADTEVKNKGSYSVSLDTDMLSNTAGQISYDTTSIEMPYLTTFSGYNQRLYLVNRGATDAAYSITFTSEAEATVVAGTGATGTIPAGEMIAVKAVDIATITGRTRTSAVIEVEAEDDDISAATQSVNLADGSTDTTVLN